MNFYVDLFLVFFRIGLFTLGGGYAMVPLIEREVVDRKKWMEGADFIDVLAIAQSLPGPIAVNTAVFVGYKTRKGLGSLVAALGATLPSFIVMILVAAFFVGIKDSPTVQKVFRGVRPAVVALIASSVWSLGRKARLGRWTGPLALGVALAVWLARVSPAYLIISLAAVGLLFPVRNGAPQPAAVVEPDQESVPEPKKDREPEENREPEANPLETPVEPIKDEHAP